MPTKNVFVVFNKIMLVSDDRVFVKSKRTETTSREHLHASERKRKATLNALNIIVNINSNMSVTAKQCVYYGNRNSVDTACSFITFCHKVHMLRKLLFPFNYIRGIITISADQV